MSVVSLFYRVFDDRLDTEVQDLLKNEVLHVENVALSYATKPAQFQAYLEQYAHITDNRITLMDDKGSVLFDSSTDATLMDNHLRRPEVKQALQSAWGQSNRLSNTTKKEYLYIARMISSQNGNLILRIARPAHLIQQDLVAVLWSLITTGLLIVMVASTLLYILIRQPLKRVSSVIQAAKELTHGRYEVRIDPDLTHNDEVTLLSSTMNQLASTLQTQMESLKDSEEKLMQILTHLESGLIVLDEDDTIVLHNYAWLHIFGHTALPEGARVFDFIRNKTIHQMIRSVQSHGGIEKQVIELNKNERIESYFTQSFQIEQQNEKLTVLTMSNVTDITRAELLKREFIANASHQLKTPLAAIQGYAETLMNLPHISEDKKIEYLQKIAQRSATATEMIVKLLTLTRIEEHDPQRGEEEVHLKDFLQSIAERHEMELKRKDIHVHFRLQDQNMKIVSYPHILAIALGALIENAIQYSPTQSHIMISVQKEDAHVNISVEDQGMGIAQEEQKHIFERFYRTEEAKKAYAQGTGVGLAMVDRCIKRLCGSISVQSQERSGTTFTIQLPENIRNCFTDCEPTGSTYPNHETFATA